MIQTRDKIKEFNQKQQEAKYVLQQMQTYWLYGSPMPHTPGYQPVDQTNDLLSKHFQFNQSFIDLVKNESAGKS